MERNFGFQLFNHSDNQYFSYEIKDKFAITHDIDKILVSEKQNLRRKKCFSHHDLFIILFII